MVKIITIANRKGGAGKSTCAAHLALESTNSGYKTILIDLDPQKTLENWWKKRPNEDPNLADVSSNEIENKISQLDRLGFEICIIDTPGDISQNAVKGIEVADLVVIPSKPTTPDLGAIGRTISMVKENKKEFIFVVTQVISRSNSALQAVSVLSEFGVVAPASIGHRISYANAMGLGGSAAEHDKNAQKEINEIWNFILTKLLIKNKEISNAKKKI